MNQDAFVNRPEGLLWAVADGAGGHARGEVASGELKAALDVPLGGPELGGAEAVGAVRARVGAVHEGLRERALDESERAGHAVQIVSTVVVLLALGEHYAVLWAGDSRAYVLRGGMLDRLTHDHSLVQELVDAGALAAERAELHPHANVLTRAVGGDGEAPVLDKASGRAEPGDRFLLCSDGLFKALDEGRIGQLLAGADPAAALIEAALSAGAADNVTAVVVAPAWEDDEPTIHRATPD